MRRKNTLLVSVMRASPVLLHFLDSHPFINRRMSSHSVPGRTHPSAPRRSTNVSYALRCRHTGTIESKLLLFTFSLLTMSRSPPQSYTTQDSLTIAYDLMTAIACISLFTHPQAPPACDYDMNCLITVPSHDATFLPHATPPRPALTSFSPPRLPFRRLTVAS